MIGAQNKCLGVADDDVQPMEKAGMGIVGFVFMGIAFQRRDVTAIAIAVDLAAIVKSGMVNFFTYDPFPRFLVSWPYHITFAVL